MSIKEALIKQTFTENMSTLSDEQPQFYEERGLGEMPCMS